MLSLLIFFITQSCKSPTAPKSVNGNVILSLDDVSCTEAWLNVKTQGVSFPLTLTIKSGSQVLYNASLSGDSLIYFDSLQPNKSYFVAGYYTANNKQQTTNQLTVQTMDTTSNNFTWQTFTFGGNAGSCNLNDVAIINDTLAYAVGEIYLDDSTGKPDPQLYNFAKWDGKTWTIERIYYSYQGQNYLAPLYSIFAFAIDDIWVGSNQPMHWNGFTWEEYNLSSAIWNGWINKIWGTSSSDLYIIGNSGTIAYYSNGTWQKIESGVTFNITDIYGVQNTIDNSSTIYMPLYNNENSLTGSALLKLTENKTEIISTPQNLFEAQSVWADNKNIVYVAGTGLFINAYGKWKEEVEFSMQSLTCVRGSGLNDIIVFGTYGLMGHFNGKTWTVYRLPGEVYTSVSVKGNLLVAVGYLNGSAIITIGKRN